MGSEWEAGGHRHVDWLLVRAAGVPMLLGFCFAMFGAVIGYGVKHDATALILLGSTGGVALFAAWLLYVTGR